LALLGADGVPVRVMPPLVWRQRVPMDQKAVTIEVAWEGPYSWPGFEDNNKLPAIPKVSGVYLQTFEYQNGYLIYAAGLTRRPVPARFREHTRKYRNGEYNILDLIKAEHGIRKEIWHGWGYAREHRDEFEAKKAMILKAVETQLSGFRIFLAEIEIKPRLLERLEATIMNTLGQQPSPICDIPDKGMMLSPRWDNEQPLVIRNLSRVRLHGLPSRLEI